MPTPREREAKEVLSVESTLTSRGQTTIPRSIRRAPKWSSSDKVRFSLRGDDTVVISRVSTEQRDPRRRHRRRARVVRRRRRGMTGADDALPVVNGWRLYAHTLSASPPTRSSHSMSSRKTPRGRRIGRGTRSAASTRTGSELPSSRVAGAAHLVAHQREVRDVGEEAGCHGRDGIGRTGDPGRGVGLGCASSRPSRYPPEACRGASAGFAV